MEFKEVKIEIYIPEEYVIELRDELNKTGALTVGNYDNVYSVTNVKGYWRPLEGSDPFDGEVDKMCEGEECKMEFRCKKELLKDALKVIRKNHPYEEPVINVFPIINEWFEDIGKS
ncbi:MAG: divalent cation tolerance protein CutA [Clostridiaceae bacterium]